METTNHHHHHHRRHTPPPFTLRPTARNLVTYTTVRPSAYCAPAAPLLK